MNPDQLSRRDFAALAVLAFAPALAVAEKPAADPLAAQADALLALAKVKYGEYLNEAQLKEVARGILRLLGSAERMKRVPLFNSDEPAVFFSAGLS